MLKISTDTEVWMAKNDGSMVQTDEILFLNAYRPLISREHAMKSRILVIDCEEESGIIKHDYKVLSCFNEPVMTKDLAGIEVPDYVYAHDWLEQHGGACTLNVEDNWIGMECEDGVFRYWDLDGNELDAPPETE